MTKSRPIKTESAVKTPVSVFRASPLKISKNVSLHIEDSDHRYQRSRLRLVVAGQGDLLPRQYLAMSRDIFGCHHRGAGHATSIQWEGAKDAAQQCTQPRVASPAPPREASGLKRQQSQD